MIQHKPLQWWADKLNSDQAFSLARFGDGELLCMLGKQGGNSHGCAYTPALRYDLLECARNKLLWHGLQRITPGQFAQARQFTDHGEWFNTEEFADALAVGAAKPLFEALSKKTVVVVSSAAKRHVYKSLKFKHFIETPLTNAHMQKKRIADECWSAAYLYGRPMVFLFACGMAAGPIISEVDRQFRIKDHEHWLIDIGHLLDPFIGDRSREYLKDIPQEILDQNLCND